MHCIVAVAAALLVASSSALDWPFPAVSCLFNGDVHIVGVLLVLFGSALSAPCSSCIGWYVADENWPLLIEQITNHTNVITSIMVYCGNYVSDNGTIVTDLSPYCIDAEGNGLLPALTKLGIMNELWLQGGDINTLRVVWSDPASVTALVNVASTYGIRGWNIGKRNTL